MPRKKIASFVFTFLQFRYADLLAVAGITVLTYLPIFRIPFIFDDIDFLFRWNDIHNFSHILPLLLGSVPQFNEGVYRPIRSLIYVVSFFFGQKNVLFYHAEALCMYLLCIGLVYAVTQKLVKNRFVTGFTTLFFSLHPLHVDNVANITASFDSWGFVFFFLAFFLFQQFTELKKSLWFFLSLCVTCLAFFTYELTLVLPFLLVLYAWYVKKRIDKKYYVGFFLLLFLYLFIRIIFLDITTRGLMETHFPEKIIAIITTTATFTATSFFPMPEMISLNIPPQGTLLPTPIQQTTHLITTQFLSSIIFLFGVGTISVFFHKKRTVIFLVLWFFISYIPIMLIQLQSATFSLTQHIYARYLFISSFGMCLLLGMLMHLLYLHIKRGNETFLLKFLSTLGFIYIALLAVYFFIITRNDIYQFRDYRTAYVSAVQKTSDIAVRYNDLGVLQVSDRNFSAAIQDFSTALKINPNYSTAKINLERVKGMQEVMKNIQNR